MENGIGVSAPLFYGGQRVWRICVVESMNDANLQFHVYAEKLNWKLSFV